MYSILLLYSHDYPFHHIFSVAQIVMKIFLHNLLPAYNTYTRRKTMPEFFPEEKEVSPALLPFPASMPDTSLQQSHFCLMHFFLFCHNFSPFLFIQSSNKNRRYRSTPEYLQKAGLKKYIHHDHVLDIFRIFYFSCGYFCKNVLHYFYMNVFSIS